MAFRSASRSWRASWTTSPCSPARCSLLSGLPLCIGQRATLVPDPDARVYGVLVDLSHDEIERLYAEPSVRMYRPEAVIAELADGARVPALCVNLSPPPRLDEVNKDYAQRLRHLALRVGLPASYVERIG